MLISRPFIYKGPFPWRCAVPSCSQPVRAGEQAISTIDGEGHVLLEHWPPDSHHWLPLDDLPLPSWIREALA